VRAGLALASLLVATLAAPLEAAKEPASPSKWPADSTAVHAALTRFIVAFENLDWEPFRHCFDDSATVFFPPPEAQERLTGRVAYEAGFKRIFDAVRPSNPSGPPYQSLIPEDLRIEPLGPGAALVSFQMRNGERIARRTIVFRKRGDRWLIAHLHASKKPIP
jgi:ketosteroid isomerase-like protein